MLPQLHKVRGTFFHLYSDAVMDYTGFSITMSHRLEEVLKRLCEDGSVIWLQQTTGGAWIKTRDRRREFVSNEDLGEGFLEDLYEMDPSERSTVRLEADEEQFDWTDCPTTSPSA